MRTFWLCSDCEFIVEGTAADAHDHHHDRDPVAWSHWIYEFTNPDPTAPGFYYPTGHAIHTSDTGGFYRDSGLTREEVFRAVTNGRIRALTHRTHA